MIRIASISSVKFAQRILKYEKLIPNIKITPYIYDNPTESPALVEQIADCDVLLFSGPLPYYLANEKIDKKGFPAVYIPTDEYTLTLTLFHTMINSTNDLNQLSIDIPKETFIKQVSEELGLSTSGWFIYSLDVSEKPLQFDADEIFRFHRDLYETKQSTFALTCVEIVYRKLHELGIPCSFMVDPEKSIHDTINKAVTYAQLAIGKSSQVAVGLIAFNQQEMREVIAKQAADLINIKLMKCGGIYPALKLVAQAEMAGIECIIGSMIESSVATAAGAHLALAKKNIIANEMGGPLLFTQNIGSLDYRGSELHLSDQPGLGIEVDENVVTDLTVLDEQIG